MLIISFKMLAHLMPHQVILIHAIVDYLNNKHCYCAVAVCSNDNLCVGSASVFYNHRMRGGISASIEDVVVHRSYRGLNIGSLLVKHLID